MVIHSFYFPPIIAKRRKLTEEYTSRLLEELVVDECSAANSCTLDCNDDSTSDCVRQVADFESSDDNILDEFSQTGELRSAQCIWGKNEKWCSHVSSWMTHPGSHLLGRTSECNTSTENQRHSNLLKGCKVVFFVF